MRLLVVSDSPALNSGLARVTRELVTRFAADAVDVAVAGWFHTVAPLMEQEPCLILPCSKKHPETVDQIIDQIEPDVVLAIGDPWDFIKLAERRVDRGGFLLVGYVNVEAGPSPAWLEATLDAFDAMATSSEAGARILDRPGVRAVHFGVDTAAFRPIQSERVAFGRVLPETFVVVVNAQNTQRKNLAVAVAGYAAFAARKTNTLLYLHTQMLPNPGEMEGQDLVELVAALGIGDQVCASRQSGPLSAVGDPFLNQVYAIGTVLLLTSLAEGFGLPVLEAMATRTVPVATDGFSMPELLAEGRGFLIPPAATFRGFHGTDLLMLTPDAVATALQEAYDEWGTGLLAGRAEAGLRFARTKTWDATYAAISDLVHGKPAPRVAAGQPVDGGLRGLARRRYAARDRVGILKLGTLGDMLQLSAVVRAAAAKYDGRPITVFTNSMWGAPILQAIEGVDHVSIHTMPQETALRSLQPFFAVFLDVRYVSMVYGEPPPAYALKHRWFYDSWAQSSARIETLASHTTQIMLESLGLEGSILPVVPVGAISVADRGLLDTIPDTAVACCTGAGSALKKWPGWDQLGPMIQSRRALVQIGGPDDPPIPEALDLRGRSLPATVQALRRVRGLVTTEGAMHHLAAAVGVPTIVLFGPTPVVSFLYPGQQSAVIPTCTPCFWATPTWPAETCAIGEKVCQRFVSADYVGMLLDAWGR